MTTTTTETTGASATPPRKDIDTFKSKVLQAILGCQAIQTAYLGNKLGWYAALAEQGPLTSVQLAATTATDERYAREWLEMQSMAGWITCETAAASPKERLYSLDPAAAHVLTNPNSMDYMMPTATVAAGFGQNLPQLLEAYKTGKGVSWAALGLDARRGAMEGTKYYFLNHLGPQLEEHIPALKDMQETGGRIADLGMGSGFSSIGMAQHFTKCTVDAYDLDEVSVLDATENVAAAGLQDRVQAHCVNAGDVKGDHYNLVIALQCIHDMADPIGALQAMRELAGNGQGVVVIADPKTQENFTGKPGDLAEQMCYGFSCMCCLPNSMDGENAAGTGTVMRPSTVRMFAQQAGYKEIEKVPVDHPFWCFYKLIV
jgi:2-polyprenyl-3-methyl-5-hydroxy-6-metoxy-1,4-benzoquinol methylase